MGGSVSWASCTCGPVRLWVRVSADQPVELFRGQLWGKSVSGFSQIPNLEAKLKFTDPRSQNSHGHTPWPPGEAPWRHLGFVQAAPGRGGAEILGCQNWKEEQLP